MDFVRDRLPFVFFDRGECVSCFGQANALFSWVGVIMYITSDTQVEGVGAKGVPKGSANGRNGGAPVFSKGNLPCHT